jgi:acetyl esterase/lipase
MSRAKRDTASRPAGPGMCAFGNVMKALRPARFKPLVAALFAASLAPLAAPAHALTADGTPPGYNANCNCYRNVAYGSTTWFEPTTRKLAHQVMDIWMPAAITRPEGAPIVYYGHPNGVGNFIAMDTAPGSLWSRLVKPLTDRGYIVVSYEFRHPVVNYVEGKPVPRYDIQKAINYFTTNFASTLAADPSNSFIAGQSRGAGLGLLTALTGTFTGSTKVQAIWTYQAQTSFNCNEMAKTYVIQSDRDTFLSQCVQVDGAGSSLQAVSPSSPPIVANYDRPFHKVLVPASEVDVHYPDFGWQLCKRYGLQGLSAQCTPIENVGNDAAWLGMADYFDGHVQAAM